MKLRAIFSRCIHRAAETYLTNDAFFPVKLRARAVCQSVFAAVAFFYSGYLMLMWQLLLMVILGFSGTLCFFLVERMQIFSIDLQEH